MILPLLLILLAGDLLEDARALLDTGKYAETVDSLEPLLAKHDYEAHLLAGTAFIAWGNEMSAEEEDPADVAYCYEQADEQLREAIAAAPPGEQRARVAASRLALDHLGDAERAFQIADEGLRRNSKDPAELQLARGCAGVHLYWAASQAGDSDGANRQWEQAVDDLVKADALLPKERVEPWVQLSWLYESNAMPKEAVSAAVEVLKRMPEASFATLFHLAHRYGGEGQLVPAGEALKAMVDRRPRDLSAMLLEQEDVTAAANALSAGVHPYAQGGDLNTAKAMLSALCAADPQAADIWNNYALMCLQSGEDEEAYRAYEKAVAIDDTDPRTLNDAGVVLQYQLKRDTDRAIELYERAIELAQAGLEAEGLSTERRAYLAEALKDASDNLRKLAQGE